MDATILSVRITETCSEKPRRAAWPMMQPGDITSALARPNVTSETWESEFNAMAACLEAANDYACAQAAGVMITERLRRLGILFKKMHDCGLPATPAAADLLLDYQSSNPDWHKTLNYFPGGHESFPVDLLRVLAGSDSMLCLLRGLSGYWRVEPLLMCPRLRALLSRKFFEDIVNRQTEIAESMGHYVQGQISINWAVNFTEWGLASGVMKPMMIDSWADALASIVESVRMVTSTNFRLRMPACLPVLNEGCCAMKTGADLLAFYGNTLADFAQSYEESLHTPMLFIRSNCGQKWVLRSINHALTSS